MNKKYLKTMASLVFALSLSWGGLSVQAQNQDSSTFFTNSTTDILNSISQESSSTEEMEDDVLPTFDGIVPAADRSFGENDISVGLTFKDRFRTYNDPDTGTAPTLFGLSIDIAPQKAGIQGAYVVLDLDGFIPSKDKPTFKHFTMNEPIFELMPFEQPDGDSVFKSIKHDKENNKLIAELKDTSVRVGNLNLDFKFNEEYLMKIPPNQIIWENINAKLYDSTDTLISSTNNRNLLSDNYNPYRPTANYESPSNSNYYNRNIVVLNRMFNQSHNRSETIKDNHRIFIEVPIGLKLITNNSGLPFETATGITNEDDSKIKKGYIRYYADANDNTFYSTNVSNNFTKYKTFHTTYEVPENLFADGDEFTISNGIEYQLVNDQKKEQISTIKYTKLKTDKWNLANLPGIHAIDMAIANPELLMENENDLTRIANIFGTGAYTGSKTIRNIGSEPIRNTEFFLTQDETIPEKINFSNITLMPSIADNSVDRAWYRVRIETKNAISKKPIQEIDIPPIKITSNYNLPLPKLSDGEYISRISIIPVGTTGAKEDDGDFPTLNSFGMRYQSKNWPKNTYPDGTKLSTNNKNIIPLVGSVKFEDKDGNIKTEQTNSLDTIIYPKDSYAMNARLGSSNSLNKEPGEIVDYTVVAENGINISKINKTWDKPEVRFGVVKELELIDPEQKKDYIDVVNNKTYKESVDVELISSDKTYNYYKLNATNASYMSTDLSKAGSSFEIPIQFKIKDKTPQGSYGFNSLALSNNNSTFVQAVSLANNNLSDDLALKLDLNNSIPSSYVGMSKSSFSTSVTVARQLNLSGTSAGRGNPSEEWTNTTGFSVEKGGTPQMLAKVENTGNTPFSKTRIYNILPGTDDGRGSTGNITFQGVTSNDEPTIYYTTKAKKDLPPYGEKIQNWSDEKLKDEGFTTTKPSDITKVTAILIDFKDKVIAPGESLEAILDFKVPNADNQRAINQFQYGSKEVGGNGELNPTSDLITFSTEIFTINYKENLPKVLTEDTEHATDIPEEGHSILLGSDGNGSITLRYNKKIKK